MHYALITAPANEPLTIRELASHLRIGTAELEEDEVVLATMIKAARQDVEKYTARALIDQTWELKMRGWGSACIRLPVLAVRSITSVKYIDPDGAEQTLAADQYRLTGAENAELIPEYGVTWPNLRGDADCVIIRWVAGFGSVAADVPEPVRSWMKLKIGTLYENRESATAGGAVSTVPYLNSLVDPYKVYSV